MVILYKETGEVPFLEKCATTPLDAFSVFLYWLVSPAMKSKSIPELIGKMTFSKKEAKKIKQIYLKSQAEPPVALSYLLSWDTEKKSFSSNDGVNVILKRLSVEKKSLFKKLVELIIAIKVGNIPWAEKKTQEIYSSWKFNIVFESKKSWFAKEREEKLRRLIDIINFVSKSKMGKNYIKLFQTFWSEFFKLAILDDQNQIQKKWSLQEIREIVRSPNFGVLVPNVWFPILYRRVHFNELKNYLKNVFDIYPFSKSPRGVLWIFEHYVPNKDKERKVITGLLKSIVSSESLIDQDLILRVLKHDYAKRVIAADFPILNRPNFVLQREHFKKILDSGVATEYAAYQLIQLGDYSDEILWWLLFQR